jgi:hypothetical protein
MSRYWERKAIPWDKYQYMCFIKMSGGKHLRHEVMSVIRLPLHRPP